MGAHFGVSCAGIALLLCAVSAGAAPIAPHSNHVDSSPTANLSDRNPLVSPGPSVTDSLRLDPSNVVSMPLTQRTQGPQDVVVKSPPALVPALAVLALLAIRRRYLKSRSRRAVFNSIPRGR